MLKKKKIIVIPQAGLGNRMRVLSSCIKIAREEDRTLWIVWPINSDLGCDITDIFESIGIDYSVPPKWARFLLTNIYRPGANKRFFNFYKFVSKFFFGSSIFDADIVDDAKLAQWVKSKPLNPLKPLKVNSNDSTLLVATCLAFRTNNTMLNYTDYLKNEDSREYFKYFKFTDYLINEVNQEYQKIGEPYIGIHIRRTDHSMLIKYSPFENYVTQIDKCLIDNPKQKFFLATDDDETKSYFTKKYKNLFYTLDKRLSREDLEGIYGAVIELLLLSKSSKIICSVISSYSNTAILMGDIKAVIYA